MEKIKKLLKSIGPGFITGAADDDPSGIGTYSQTGAQFGYNQLWTALFSFPFMTVVQEMCGRIGMVTGKGLSSVIKNHYSKNILFGLVGLLFLANTINLGADLGAMASSAQLLFHIPFVVWLVLITLVSLVLQINIPYPQYAKFLRYLTFSLLAYIVVALITKQPWGEIALKTFVPSFSFTKSYLFNIVAILGTTISAYLFFWETDQEAEEDFAEHRVSTYGEGTPNVTKEDIRAMRFDTMSGMLFSNLVMFFIIMTVASTLGAHGITNIDTADQAASALRPLAGDFAYLLFAAGIIGTGLLAVPILAGSAAYALSEAMGWKAGLNYKFGEAKAFYVVIIISTFVGAVVNFLGIPPFKMLYYTAILNGIIAPPILVMLMLIANNKDILGEHTNGWFSNLFGWIITTIMSLCAIALLVSLLL
ncbi:divalent metal cation transporter [Patescibacteria group bacterium]|nr:divalent metal cation transporter [Patescibacteria group bacterium]